MAKLAGKRSRKAGLPPGTLVHTGERKTQTPRITLFDYDEQNFQEKQPTRIEECFPFKETATVTWINIDGLHDVELIKRLGKQFELHPLILEDILSTEQRPKLEDYDKHLFIVIRMLTYNGQADSVETEQVSMVVGPSFLIQNWNPGETWRENRVCGRRASNRAFARNPSTNSVSKKVNSIMKVLTIIASIFIPLTFIVGVYGMNFPNMPELRWRWSYPLVRVVIIASAVGMLVYFRKKKWF
jgi:Mg2+ and Co2+ transporter CorA